MTVEKQTVLKAENSKILTNGNTYGTVVYLAPEDSENNWYEITVEEYKQIFQQESTDNDNDISVLE